MDNEDLKIIVDFFNCDEELKNNLRKNFYQFGEISLEDATTDIISLLSRKLELRDEQIDELRYNKRRISQKLAEKFVECSEEYAFDFCRISTSPEELTNGTLAVSEKVCDQANRYCRMLRGKLDELEDHDIAKSYSNSSFSRFSQYGVDYIRNFIDQNYGSQAVRNYDYYCESDVRDRLNYGVREATVNVSRKSQSDLNELQLCTRRMNKQESKIGTSRVSSLL